MSFQSSVENCSNPIRNKNLNHSFGEKPLEKASGIEILHRVVCFSNRHVNFGLDMITNLPTPQDEKVYDHSDFVNPSFFKEPDPFYLGPELESFSTAATSLLGNKGIL
ncbi:hypothetical protein BY996DRAFT_6428997 [Phakopsora pachyrhizi]|nr:hypothetical protein BY996DRAFT_6428997 [Phakopsora pachyrhizi]